MSILGNEIKQQLAGYLPMLESDIVLGVNAQHDELGQKVHDLVNEIAEMSPRISVEATTACKAPGFGIAKKGEAARVFFAGLPLGHEFTSLVMALLQVSGRPPKIDDKVMKRIAQIKEPMAFETYVSLSCHNCPEVVQAFNIMAVLNEQITHTMIEGGWFQDEIKEKNIMGVPTVLKGDEQFANGRMEIEEIINKLLGEASSEEFDAKDPFDVLVVGGGPAGASAAIYAARKGIRTGLVAERFGGQPLETMGIENIIGTKYTQGPKFVAQLEEHVNEYDVDVMKATTAVNLERKGNLVEVTLSNGAILKSKTAVLSTGARWRDLNVPGEEQFKTKGIAYCPHCDGPLFKGKRVAVVGGGNSGVEAAIDLAGVVEHVTVVEYADKLLADTVLQEKLQSLSNVDIILNAATTEITGDTNVKGLIYTDRVTNETKTLDVEGIFILIGLIPNTNWLKGSIEMDPRGQIIVDGHGATSVEGVYAAGDCTNSIYKQIIISMGSGATAALGAFDYIIRN